MIIPLAISAMLNHRVSGIVNRKRVSQNVLTHVHSPNGIQSYVGSEVFIVFTISTRRIMLEIHALFLC